MVELEDDEGNRERWPIRPEQVPHALWADYQRLRADYRDALEAGHAAEACHAYLWSIGAI